MRKKPIIISLLCLLALFQYQIWQSPGNVRDVHHLQQAINTQTEEINRLTLRNQQLRAEVAALKANPMALEERARSELGMIRKNETFCLVIDKAKEEQ